MSDDRVTIRDARPEDAPFLAKSIMAGMHVYDFVPESHRHAFGVDFQRMIFII